MKKLVREAVRDALILSVLVILPMHFLGPGWTPPVSEQKTFAQQHQVSSNETPLTTARPDRDIPILRAFEVERASKNR